MRNIKILRKHKPKCQIAEQQQVNFLLCLMENVKAKYWAFLVETQS